MIRFHTVNVRKRHEILIAFVRCMPLSPKNRCLKIRPKRTAEISFSDYQRRASIFLRSTMRNYRTILKKIKPKPLEPFISGHFKGFGSKSELSNYIIDGKRRVESRYFVKLNASMRYRSRRKKRKGLINLSLRVAGTGIETIVLCFGRFDIANLADLVFIIYYFIIVFATYIATILIY